MSKRGKGRGRGKGSVGLTSESKLGSEPVVGREPEEIPSPYHASSPSDSQVKSFASAAKCEEIPPPYAAPPTVLCSNSQVKSFASAAKRVEIPVPYAGSSTDPCSNSHVKSFASAAKLEEILPPSPAASSAKLCSNPQVKSLTSAVGIGRGRRQQKHASSQPEELTKDIANLSIQKGISPQPAGELTKDVTSLALMTQDSSPTALGKSSSVVKFAPRPNYGKAGYPIQLVSNYFQLECQTGTIYQYDVTVTSLDQVEKYGKSARKKTAAEAFAANHTRIEHQVDKSIGKIRSKEIFEKLVKINKYEKYCPVYDGSKTVFTIVPLPFQLKMAFKVELEYAGRLRNYQLEIQPVRKENGSNAIDVHSLLKTYEGQNELIMFLNSIMNHRDPSCVQIQLGRSFFYLNQQKKTSLGEGLEIWFGYNQSVHLTHSGPAVLLNLSAKAFHKGGPVINYASDVLGKDITRISSDLNVYEKKKLDEALKGIKVCVTHLPYPRKFTVQSVTKSSAQKTQIDMDGKKVSIAQYFQMKYGKLQYPHLPCLFMKASNNQTYLPLEHCSVVDGQPKVGKISGSLTTKMIRQTAITPVDRFRAITQSLKDVQRESGKKMQSYSLFMDLVPKNVEGRVIDRPSLSYYNNATSDPDNRGVWSVEGKNFYRASIDIESWILLCFSDQVPREALSRFAEMFSRTGKRVGLNFGKLICIKKFGYNDTTEDALNQAKNSNATFAVIILSRRDRFHNYDEIKFIADYKLGFITQCIEDIVLKKFNDQIATNVCLKINTKLGGVNHILKNRPRIFAKPVMILGADAVHNPRGSGCPSIAAVVGSMDSLPSKYKVECRVQENPDGNKVSQEIILDIEAMVEKLLDGFRHHTKGKYPEKIIFFRDGVSEGQFSIVRDKEVGAVQAASLKVIGHIIPITYIVVQKRHQTRFRPCNPRDGIGRGGNIPPGTTVDSDITHPDLFDYFLNSHEGIQGTSKPAHYTVLHDDNKFDADELQMLSYHLCYTYGKCNRSISIPAPVMYADLACYRAKKYADFHINKESSSASSSSSGSRLPDHVRLAIDSMGQFRNAMFFV